MHKKIQKKFKGDCDEYYFIVQILSMKNKGNLVKLLYMYIQLKIHCAQRRIKIHVKIQKQV